MGVYPSPHPSDKNGLEISQHLKGRFVALFPDIRLISLVNATIERSNSNWNTDFKYFPD